MVEHLFNDNEHEANHVIPAMMALFASLGCSIAEIDERGATSTDILGRMDWYLANPTVNMPTFTVDAEARMLFFKSLFRQCVESKGN